MIDLQQMRFNIKLTTTNMQQIKKWSLIFAAVQNDLINILNEF